VGVLTLLPIFAKNLIRRLSTRKKRKEKKKRKKTGTEKNFEEKRRMCGD